MEIVPCIINVGMKIEPDVVLVIDENIGVPFVGFIISSKNPIILPTENFEVALSLNECLGLNIEGRIGITDAKITSFIDESQMHIKGGFGSNFADYFIAPTETGVNIKGLGGGKHIDLKIDSIGNISRLKGTINKENIEFSIKTLTENMYRVEGILGKNTIDINIFYKEEGINIKGKNCTVYVDYSVKSLGDKIELKGITKDGFIKHIYALEEENAFHIYGKFFKVPVDYHIHLFENGLKVVGNTGFHKSDYTITIPTEES